MTGRSTWPECCNRDEANGLHEACFMRDVTPIVTLSDLNWSIQKQNTLIKKKEKKLTSELIILKENKSSTNLKSWAARGTVKLTTLETLQRQGTKTGSRRGRSGDGANFVVHRLTPWTLGDVASTFQVGGNSAFVICIAGPVQLGKSMFGRRRGRGMRGES